MIEILRYAQDDSRVLFHSVMHIEPSVGRTE